MNKEYNKYFDLFHKEKSILQSNKKKYLKCDGCENNKKIIEKDNKLLFNCGSKKGECGDQFEIILPEYINYYVENKRLNELINGSFTYNEDINDLSEYNLETLDKYMKIPDELKKQNEIIKDSEEKKIELEKKYKSLNDITSKKELIQEYNTIKTKGEITKRKLLRELTLETTTDERKREIKKEYAKLIYENEKQIGPLLDKLNEKNKYEIKIKEEEINISNEIKEKEEKPKKKTTEKNRIGPKKDTNSLLLYFVILDIILNKISDKDDIVAKDLLPFIEDIKERTETFKGKVNQGALGQTREQLDRDLLYKRLDDMSDIGYLNKKVGGKFSITDMGKKHHSNYKEKKNDTNKNEKLIELMIDKFKENDGILTKIEFKKITEENDFKTKWSSLLFKSLQNKGTNSWLKKKQEKYGSIIVVPDSKNPKMIQLTDNWMEHLKIKKDKKDKKDKKEESKRKGLGDELEELQVEIMKSVSKGVSKNKSFND